MEILISLLVTWFSLGFVAFSLLVLLLRVSKHRSKNTAHKHPLLKRVTNFK
jgi:hypothetical protein